MKKNPTLMNSINSKTQRHASEATKSNKKHITTIATALALSISANVYGNETSDLAEFYKRLSRVQEFSDNYTPGSFVEDRVDVDTDQPSDEKNEDVNNYYQPSDEQNEDVNTYNQPSDEQTEAVNTYDQPSDEQNADVTTDNSTDMHYEALEARAKTFREASQKSSATFSNTIKTGLKMIKDINDQKNEAAAKKEKFKSMSRDDLLQYGIDVLYRSASEVTKNGDTYKVITTKDNHHIVIRDQDGNGSFGKGDNIYVEEIKSPGGHNYPITASGESLVDDLIDSSTIDILNCS